jgi:hypothetical protein
MSNVSQYYLNSEDCGSELGANEEWFILFVFDIYCSAANITFERSWDSLFGIVTRLQAGLPWFDSWQGHRFFLFSTSSRLALGPTQPSVQWVSGSHSSGVKQLGHEADQLPPSSAEVKNAQSYTTTPLICFLGMVLS